VRRLTLAALLAGCGAGGGGAGAGPSPAGGDTTVEDRSSKAYSRPAPNLDADALARHVAGDAAFEAKFVSAPAPVHGGLGPLYDHVSCAGCHVGDGRGLPVAGVGPRGTQLVVRVSLPRGTPDVPGGAVPVPGIGLQVRDHAVGDAVAPARIALTWDEAPGRYGDGTPYSLRSPRVALEPADGVVIPADVQVSLRVAPPVFGLGLLEAVPGDELEALADPDDADGDGLSGRVNHVWDAQARRAAVGRFGLKANVPSLRQQVAGAYANDMGVSSPLFPDEGGGEDIDARTLDDTTFYAQTLGVPGRAGREERGEALFESMGCGGCHLDTLTTGDHPVAALRDQVIHPYTDLLLHDLGDGLADGRPDFEADGREWRTAPLWGLGAAKTVLLDAGFLHDGRARTPAEAILWHGGEAERAREAFRTASCADREALLAFLRSL
jgi:CxxC motif-containing protein (DUF1111 family)